MAMCAVLTSREDSSRGKRGRLVPCRLPAKGLLQNETCAALSRERDSINAGHGKDDHFCLNVVGSAKGLAKGPSIGLDWHASLR